MDLRVDVKRRQDADNLFRVNQGEEEACPGPLHPEPVHRPAQDPTLAGSTR